MSPAADAGEYIEGIDENMILQGIRVGIKIGREIKVTIQVEPIANCDGILNQMEKVKKLSYELESETYKLRSMINEMKLQEMQTKGASEKAPTKERIIDGEKVSESVQKAIYDTARGEKTERREIGCGGQ